MSSKNQNARILFGLKVKQLRAKKKLSFAELSQTAGLSISYLNEIEKGKKYPKKDKIVGLARALDVDEAYLVSEEYDEGIAPVAKLLHSNFLNELPLDLFGIELSKVVEIIASAPARVGAFISTLLEISRNYALREENFYFSALRSYLELHNNYFPEIEEAVLGFEKDFNIPSERPFPGTSLQLILEQNHGYQVLEKGLDQYPELSSLRGVFLPEQKQLLLSSQLTPIQRSFQYGKELAFNYLSLAQRAYTSTLLKSKSFEEVLNHSKAIYFSVALHIPVRMVCSDMEQFFGLKKWDPAALLRIMRKYDATPEMFYHRLTNILPQFFGIKKMFFLRIVNRIDKNHFEIDRELHLNHRHQPHGNALEEHYCRRWVGISLLKELKTFHDQGKHVEHIIRAQISTYVDTQEQYLVLTIGRSAYPVPNKNVSVVLGLLINDQLREQIQFLNDPTLDRREVHTTCERCFIQDCQERAAAPIIINKRKQLAQIQNKLNELLEG